jgi:hypothetical protein
MTELITGSTDTQPNIDNTTSVASEQKAITDELPQDAEPSTVISETPETLTVFGSEQAASEAKQTAEVDHPNFNVTSQPVADKPAARAVETMPTSEVAETSESNPVCSISLQFLDCHGWAIPMLAYRVLDISNKIKGDTRPSDPAIGNIKMIASGKTDAKGNADLLEGLTLGMRLEFQIKNDQGIYKLAAIDTVRGTQGNACLRSPKDKFTIATYAHDGDSGLAEKKKEEQAKKHNQTKAADTNISINADKNVKPTVGAKENNSQGNPVAAIKDGLVNMWGQNKNKVDPPKAGQSDLDKVNKLIDFATAQAATIDSGDVSATIIKKMKDGGI